MFAATHMAAGALIEAKMRKKAPTALIAVASAAVLDMTVLWHAPYPWPSGSPAILTIIPYPHDALSTFMAVTLVVSAVAVAWLLCRYWWGMLWGLSPDITDWVILRPLTGRYQIHRLFPQVATHWGPWSFGLEMLLVISAALLAYRSMRKQQTGSTPAR